MQTPKTINPRTNASMGAFMRNRLQWRQGEDRSEIKSYRVGKHIFQPAVLKNTGDWGAIRRFLETSCNDIRSTVCFRCGASAGNLYDKNNVAYKISRSLTLQQVKDLVEEIRKINNG